MRVYLLRHGETAYNAQRRYQGSLDIPLSPEGEARLCQADFDVKEVFVSPMCRARRTAELLFPHARQRVEEALREMDFGSFEGHSAQEMEEDTDYRAWVEGGCMGRCPGGEDMAGFRSRVCGAFARMVEEALARGDERLAVVSHGGVQMAVMERFALPQREYFQWMAPNGGGFLLETDPERWKNQQKLCFLEVLQYTKGEGT